MARTITWLHFSDLHSCSPKSGWDAGRVLSQLLVDLKRMEDDYDLHPDFIFFTGDAAWGQIPGSKLITQFDVAENLFKQVRSVFRQTVDQENFFLVPGNHDVDREETIPDYHEWLDRQTDIYVINDIVKSSGKKWKNYMERLKEYIQFLRRTGYDHLLTDAERATHINLRTIHGVKIGIAGFNSAWSCCREIEVAKLWLGQKWQSESFRNHLEDADFSIALIHHPFNWFVEPERHAQRRDLERDFRFCLHGHEHEQWVWEGIGHTTISAGACYERADRRNGYNFVQINLDDGSGRVCLRAFDPKSGGWVPDPVARKAPEGEWQLTLPWLASIGRKDFSAGSSLVGGASLVRLSTVTLDLQVALASGQSAVAAQDIIEGPKRTDPSGKPITLLAGEANIAMPQRATDELVGMDPGTEQIRLDIDDAAQPILDCEPLKVLDRLHQVERRHRGKLSAHDAFRIAANKGHAYRIMMDYTSAANLYRAAATCEPDSVEARYLDALADSLVGNDEPAHKKINDLLADDVPSAKAIALWLNTAPPTASIDTLVVRVPEEYASTLDVLGAMSKLASDRKDFQLAEKYARRATEEDPTSHGAKLVLACIILNGILAKGVRRSSPIVPERGAIETAKALLMEVLSTIQLYAVPQELARIRVHLASALTLLGDDPAAERELARARAESPRNVDAIIEHALLLGRLSRTDEAISALEQWASPSRPLSIELILAKLLIVRGRGNDRQRAVLSLAARTNELVSESPEFRIDWINAAIQTQLDLKPPRFVEARTALESIPADWLPGEVRLVLEAEIARAEGNEPLANTKTDAACLAVADSNDLLSIARVALLAESLGKYDKALELWRRLTSPPAHGTEARHMVRCAQRCQRIDVVLDYCKRLRESGVFDRDFILTELATLERTIPEEAVRTIEALTKEDLSESFKRELRAQSSYLAIILGRDSGIETRLEMLPSVNDLVTPAMGRAVVEVLVHGGRIDAAQYAYELFRRFPDELDSYLAVIRSTGFPKNLISWPDPHVAQIGTAVHYREDDTQKDIWTIIEERPDLKPSLQERGADDPIAKSMLGKVSGSNFILRDVPLRTGTILKVVNKFTFRVQFCREEIEARFPGDSPLSVIHLPKNSAGEPDISPLLEQIDRRSRHLESVFRWYENNPVSLFMLAEQLGKTVFESVQFLASNPKLHLRCALGTHEEAMAAENTLQTAATVVLDMSVIGTLFSLGSFGGHDLVASLRKLPSRPLIAEAAITELRQLLRDMTGEKAVIGKDGGRYFTHETSAEAVQETKGQLLAFIESLESFCEVVPGKSVNVLDSDTRAKLYQLFGRVGTESISLAIGPTGVLWTDDLTLGEIARHELQVPRCWTHAVVHWMATKEIIKRENEDEIAVRLMQMNYKHTGLSPSAMIFAGEISGWNLDSTPFAQALDRFGDPSSAVEPLYYLAATFLRELWRRPILDIAREAITIRIIARLASLSNGKKILNLILRDIDSIFGLDVIHASRVTQLIAAWSTTRDQRIIVP